MPLSREFEVSDFTIFSGEDEKFTIEHISQFTIQCGKANQNEYHKLQLFPLFLTMTTFIWYSFLPPNSVQNWEDMEWLFRNRFYWPEPEGMIVDLMSLKQRMVRL